MSGWQNVCDTMFGNQNVSPSKYESVKMMVCQNVASAKCQVLRCRRTGVVTKLRAEMQKDNFITRARFEPK